jgi:hypothetical protein
MKMFIWEREEKVTDNYHDEAGIAVIAATLERAQIMIIEYSKGAWRSSTPQNSYDLEGSPEEKLFIFPDAGCC